MGTRLARQRLDHAEHGSAADWIELAADEHRAIQPPAQLEPALLDLFGLLGGISLGIGRVPGVVADVEELAGRALFGLLDQDSLVKALPERVGGTSHRREMRKADLAVEHGLVTLRQLLEHLADRDRIGGRACVHVAVEAHPVDRADRAVLVPSVRRGKLSRLAGESNFQQIDHPPALKQPLTQQVIGTRRVDVLRREHRNQTTKHPFDCQGNALTRQESNHRSAVPSTRNLTELPRGCGAWEEGPMRIGERYQLATELRDRYWAAGRGERGQLLDAFCLATGYNRKYAIAMLRGRRRKPRVLRRLRRRRYGKPFQSALAVLWEASGYICAE